MILPTELTRWAGRVVIATGATALVIAIFILAASMVNRVRQWWKEESGW